MQQLKCFVHAVVNAGSTVVIIRDANRSRAPYSTPLPWRYLGSTQIDQYAGMELVFDFNGLRRILNDRLKTWQ